MSDTVYAVPIMSRTRRDANITQHVGLVVQTVRGDELHTLCGLDGGVAHYVERRAVTVEGAADVIHCRACLRLWRGLVSDDRSSRFKAALALVGVRR